MPRIVLPKTAPSLKSRTERITSGISGLDKLIQGGFVKGSTYMVAGQTGTGKSLFSLQYLLEGLRKGENGVYLSLEQNADEILEDSNSFGWRSELEKHIAAGKLLVVSQAPSDMKELESVAFQYAKRINAKRFVLDSLSIATMSWRLSSMDVGKVRNEIFSFINMLEKIGVTSFLITEIPESEKERLSRFGVEEFLVDGIIKLNYLGIGEAAYNNLEIRKMRRTKHAKGIFQIEFSKDGLRIVTERGSLHF